MANEFVARKGLIVSGSTQLTGSLNVSRGITGSLFGTSSWANNADLLDGLNSTVFASTGSNTFVGNQIITGSLILSSSIPVELQVIGNVEITGSLATQTYSLTTSSLGNASGSMSINLTNANYFTAITSASTIWTFNNFPVNRATGFVLTLTSGGSATQTWPTSVRWPTGLAPTLTIAGVDVLTFFTVDSGSNWRGVLSMTDSK